MEQGEQINEVETPILAADVPVRMPELPLRFSVTTTQQFKALGDPLRIRVLNIIRHQPATAKQLADRLKVSPGAMGHHLRVLQDAGLAQIVARRLQRGIVASYYTRTARIFDYDMPHELEEKLPAGLDILSQARDELAEALTESDGSISTCQVGLPHVRLSPERLDEYNKRVNTLIEDFLNEPADPHGEVYALSLALFTAPRYMQATPDSDE